MGNQIGNNTTIKINSAISNAFQSILKCPSSVDMNNKLNSLLNGKYLQSEWVGSILSDDIRLYYHEYCQTVEKVLQFAIDFLYDTAISQQKELSKEQVNAINNCLRMVVKIIPVLYENHEKMMNFLWKIEDLNYSVHNLQANNNNRIQVIRSNDQEIERKLQNNLSWGIKLITSLEILCFYPSYTIVSSAELDKIPKESELGEQFNNKYLWNNIFKYAPHLNSTSKFDENKMLVLSAILACISSTLYVPVYGKNYLNPWITYLTSPLNQRNGLFFMNLLFQTLSFKSQIIDRKTQSLSKRISLLCSQIAYAILCHHPNRETINDILEISIPLQEVNNYLLSQINENERPTDSFLILQNGVINYFNDLKGEEIQPFFKEIIERLMAILEQPLQSENSLFLNSLKEVEFVEEAFGILFQLLHFCPNLYKFLCTQESYLKRLFKVNIYQFCKSLDQMNQNNTYFVSMSLLTILTNNSTFNEILNSPKNFNINLRYFPIIDGTLADLLISCCAQAMINNKFNFSLCHPFNLMIILKNISPQVKNLSSISCQKLNQLVNLFTQMDFMLQHQYSSHCIAKLLQMFDNILGCNFINNLRLVYEIHQRQEVFTRIPKINFNEKTLRLFYQKYSQQNQIVVPQPQNNKKIDEISSDIESNQNKSPPKEEQQHEGEEEIKEKENQQIEQDVPNKPNSQKEQLDSSTSLSGKKRPSRVVRKKEKNPSLKADDHENATLAQKDSKRGSRRGSQRQEKEQNEVVQKENQPFKEINILGANSNQQSEENNKEGQSNEGKGEIIFYQKKPEDLFVEKWRNLNWPELYSSIPQKNLNLIIKNVNEFANNSLKKNRLELTYEIFSSEKSFLNGLKNQMKPNTNIVLEQFSNFEDILILSSQCCWMQIITKSDLFPDFKKEKILFFRSDIPPHQINLNDQSIDVECQSQNQLTDPK